MFAHASIRAQATYTCMSEVVAIFEYLSILSPFTSAYNIYCSVAQNVVSRSNQLISCIAEHHPPCLFSPKTPFISVLWHSTVASYSWLQPYSWTHTGAKSSVVPPTKTLNASAVGAAM